MRLTELKTFSPVLSLAARPAGEGAQAEVEEVVRVSGHAGKFKGGVTPSVLASV